MPSKTSKRARRAAAKTKTNLPSHKDDGTRWLVLRHGRPVYPSQSGTTRAEAERLAAGLAEPAVIVQVSLA